MKCGASGPYTAGTLWTCDSGSGRTGNVVWSRESGDPSRRQRGVLERRIGTEIDTGPDSNTNCPVGEGPQRQRNASGLCTGDP